MNEAAASPADYSEVLADYLLTHSEQSLYRASLLSQTCIENGLGPEDLIALHFEGLERALEGRSYRERAQASGDAQQFLLDVMIAYGVKFKEYLELKLSETLRDAEARAVRERERMQELERLQREKSEILAVIAHELRTPLTVARGSIEMVLRSLDVEQAREVSLPALLGDARDALDRLSRLTGDLVEASRGEMAPLELEPLDLVSVVAQACSWARPAAISKNVSLDLQTPDAKVLAHANTDALLSTFGNLLSNAIRYTPAGGHVDVRLGIQGGWVAISVEDTGIGITPEALARIFEKFYRAPEAQRLEPRGLGLGLSLVRQMAEAHGGQVEVESEPGRGSNFRVLLPAAPPAL